MAKWQNRMTKMVKSTIENTKVSSTDTDEIRVAINEVLDTPLPTQIDTIPEIATNIAELASVEESSDSKSNENLDSMLNSVTEQILEEKETVDFESINIVAETEILAEPIVVTEPEVVVEPITPRVIETSVIHAGTRILGNIESDDFLILYANINGNINCAQKLTAYASINGDVVADSVEYHGVAQTGNITAKDSCIISSDKTTVNGNITCANLACNGAVNGNINCTDTCYLEETANVVGDIHTGKLSIKPGAIIKGKITMGNSSFNQ